MDSALCRRFLAFLKSDLAAAAHNEAIHDYPPEFKRIPLRGWEAWLAVTETRFDA
jgi:hypothetical protein